ncbi:MAG: thiolase domain-containing protein [Candidatus Aenigmarchaeota archaeon]|nr:thiolase domain-containing protein [Candidatus Aenigmarchaeota archaeon]
MNLEKLKPKREVAIIGIGITKFGEHWKLGLRDLAVEAGMKAVDDAGISGKDIQLVVGGNMSGGLFVGQEHGAGLLADYLGLTPTPAIRTEAACSSGGLAVRVGYLAVASGLYDIVVAGGVEKMTDVYGPQATTALAGAMDYETEAYFGATFPCIYALIAQRHMYQYGTTREQLAMVSVKNHKNALENPFAQYRRPITVDDVLNSPLVADPLRLLDCSPITDGAAAVILTSADIAKKYTDTPIYIKASAQASDTLSLFARRDITTLDATVMAAKSAYKQARVSPNDIDLAEVHDCFTIAEICAYEDLGFAKKGEGGKLIQEGQTEIGGKIPVNTSGGLKAKGHPVGATGIAQIVEIVKQLRGEAGKRQVSGAEVGLAHNVGGSGATATVHILSNKR